MAALPHFVSIAVADILRPRICQIGAKIVPQSIQVLDVQVVAGSVAASGSGVKVVDGVLAASGAGLR